jgi:hypothetical protein
MVIFVDQSRDDGFSTNGSHVGYVPDWLRCDVGRPLLTGELPRGFRTGNLWLIHADSWPRDYKEQVLLFTRNFPVSWTNNVSERGAKAAKRHQAVSGYWHSPATLARWCRLRSYLDSVAAHGVTALDAIRGAITGKP